MEKHETGRCECCRDKEEAAESGVMECPRYSWAGEERNKIKFKFEEMMWMESGYVGCGSLFSLFFLNK